jgi:hypothetical protein
MKRLYNKIYRISFPAVYSTSVEDLSFIKTYIELVFYVYVYVYRMHTYIFHHMDHFIKAILCQHMSPTIWM